MQRILMPQWVLGPDRLVTAAPSVATIRPHPRTEGHA